ncbi:hypothetical protein Y1Q_0024466 [Alligator mississippiensis]|uniref:Uncharacterized protein n=1 Tax=Alligator mississippiensis TaxID=8496 RepID=A0A151NAM5_ALLMI|nr:hypothetical protein Y1Q_0024466 [Alligator mississippiensis]
MARSKKYADMVKRPGSPYSGKNRTLKSFQGYCSSLCLGTSAGAEISSKKEADNVGHTFTALNLPVKL